MQRGADLSIKQSMLAKVCSATVMGVEACAIEVEVNFGFADAQRS